MKVAKRPSAQKSYREHRKKSGCSSRKLYACAADTKCKIAKGKKRSFCRTLKNKKSQSMVKKQIEAKVTGSIGKTKKMRTKKGGMSCGTHRNKKGGMSHKNKKGGMHCYKK